MKMQKYWTNATEAVRNFLNIAPDIFGSILWTITIILAYFILRKIIARFIIHHVEDTSKRYTSLKTSNYIFGIVAGLLILRVWVGGLGGLMTYFGILSAGLAIALQDPLMNIAGWLFIITRKPFVVGDRIEINGSAGDVIDIRPFQFSIMEIGNWVDADQSTGRIMHLPNGLVFKNILGNYTQGFNFIWNEIAVTVTFESDWQKAKNILKKIAADNNPVAGKQAEDQIRSTSHTFLIFFEHFTPIVWTLVADSGVTLTIRYLCDPRKRRFTETEIWENILREFAAAPDIDFAYPTQRFYFNPTEGKPQSGGIKK